MDVFEFLNFDCQKFDGENCLFNEAAVTNDHFTARDQKIAIWKNVRDEIVSFFNGEVIPALQRASLVYNISNSNENDPHSVFLTSHRSASDSDRIDPYSTFEDQANAFVHLDKLHHRESDCLRFYPFILNFHQQIQFVTIMKPEVLEKYIQVISKWLNTLYFCRFDEKCPDNTCGCHEEYFHRVFNRINHNNLTVQKVLSHSSPCEFVRSKLFGKLYQKCIEILRDLDNFIPSYSEIFASSPQKFLHFLTSDFLDFNFSISRVSGATTVSVQNENDRFMSVYLHKKYDFCD